MTELTIKLRIKDKQIISECPEINEWCDYGKNWYENLTHLLSDIGELQNKLLKTEDNKLGPEMVRIKNIFLEMNKNNICEHPSLNGGSFSKDITCGLCGMIMATRDQA